MGRRRRCDSHGWSSDGIVLRQRWACRRRQVSAHAAQRRVYAFKRCPNAGFNVEKVTLGLPAEPRLQASMTQAAELTRDTTRVEPQWPP